MPANEKAWGKAPTMEPPPMETDEELVLHLQWEKYAAENARPGQDAATLAVVK